LTRCDAIQLGVLIGGGGRTLLNIHKHIVAHGLPARIACVIAARADLPGVHRAREAGLDVTALSKRELGSVEAVDRAIINHLRRCGVELACMAGYLHHLRIDPSFRDRVMNIHPALLPCFGGKGMYGLNVHRAVLEHGCKVSGCTVHFVDENYDNGPIILQKTCAVLEDDTPETLAARVFELECRAYPEAIRLFAEGRLRVEGRRVLVADGSEKGLTAVGNDGNRGRSASV